MENYTLNAQPRDVLKKKVKLLRQAGFIPAAIFGYKGNENIQIDAKEFSKLYDQAGHTSVIEVDVNGTKHSVIIDEVQMNPATREYTHVSLRELRMDVEITAEIPFELIGDEESPAVKDEQSLVILSVPSVELRGLPKNLPQEIKIDVSGFHAGDTIILKDVKLPDGVELVHAEEEDLEMTIVTTTSAIQEEIIEDVNAAIEEAVAEGEQAEEGAEAAEGEAKAEKEE